jgi:dienelactone hydrolase
MPESTAKYAAVNGPLKADENGLDFRKITREGIGMKRLLWLVLMGLLTAGQAHAAIQTLDVDYKDGSAELQGTVIYDDSISGTRPGVLVFHEWKGPTAYERGRAEKLAQLGYVAFVADIYGKGVRPTNPDECGAQATKYKSNRTLMRERAKAALAELKKQEIVDPARIAAIGYCFGGTTALELARSGADIVGAVSFHGGLDSPDPNDTQNIRAKILVLHGADDTTMSPEVVATFLNGMKKSNVDWQFVEYSGARHGFSNSANGNDPKSPVAYNGKVDRRSWEAMKNFLGELFGK